MNHTLLRFCAALLLIGLGLFWNKPAEAAPAPVSCTASMTGMAFGNVNPLSSKTDANATLSYTCSNKDPNTPYYVKACFSIGDGAQGNGQTNPRQMEDLANNILQFQLYQDPSHSTVWGNQLGPFPTPLVVDLLLAPKEKISGSATMYGEVLDGQNSAIPDNYQDMFNGNYTAITVATDQNAPPSTCNGVIANGATFPFTVTADFISQCYVSANTLDFGTIGLLNAGATGASTIQVQCANQAAYNVGLDGGQNSGNNINARKMVLGANSVAYQLYRDSSRTQVWGNTVNTDTVAGTGTGSIQNLTVYGQVPAQPTPPAGTYTDTVVVSVTY